MTDNKRMQEVVTRLDRLIEMLTRYLEAEKAEHASQHREICDRLDRIEKHVAWQEEDRWTGSPSTSS